MGHNRLGSLPDTRPWRAVVGLIADGASAAAVAAATSAAAVDGLERGQHDRGVAHAVFLLARTALAARQPDFARGLGSVGVHCQADPPLFTLTAALAAAMRDAARARRSPRTDLGEMAALAATETVAAAVGDRVAGLFPSGGDVRRAVREFATRNGFAALAYEFFARFTRRFLLYHLGRELSQHVGGAGRFADHAAHTAFVVDLDTHCREAALVVRAYAGGWYDKARFERGITEHQARRFAAYCLGGKLRPELARRGRRDG